MDSVVAKKHATMELNALEVQRISTQQLKTVVNSALLDITVKVEKPYYVHEEDTQQISVRKCVKFVLKGKCVMKLEWVNHMIVHQASIAQNQLRQILQSN